MSYIEKSWWGRVRLRRNHPEDDFGPKVTQTKRPSIIKSLAALAEANKPARRKVAKNGG